MKFRVEERIEANADEQQILSALEKEFEGLRVLGEKLERRDDRLIVGRIIGGAAGTSFWIYRDDSTEITVNKEGDAYLCVAEVDYRPSKGYYTAVWLTGLLSIFGWIQPVIMYQLQKRAVRRYIEDAFTSVKRRLQKSGGRRQK